MNCVYICHIYHWLSKGPKRRDWAEGLDKTAEDMLEFWCCCWRKKSGPRQRMHEDA